MVISSEQTPSGSGATQRPRGVKVSTQDTREAEVEICGRPSGGGVKMTASEHKMSIQEGFEPGEVRGALILIVTMILLVGLVIGDLARVGMPPTPLTQPRVTRLAPGLVARFSSPALRRPHRVPQRVASAPMIIGALQILAGSRAR